MRAGRRPSRRLPPSSSSSFVQMTPRGRGRAQAERRVVVAAKRGRFLIGELLFERGGRLTLGGGRRAAAPGRMALVELGPNRAKVVSQLGDPKVAADVIEGLMLDRGLRRGFSRRLEAEAAAAAEAAGRDAGERRDLTGLATF